MTSHSARPSSVLLDALGADAARLDARLVPYLAGSAEGDVVCTGVFDVAGGRFRRLGLLARPVAGPELVIARFGRDVPFRVVNREVVTPRGHRELRAERVFTFGSSSERFADALRLGRVPGTLINVLGRARRLALVLCCTVTDEGFLRIHSEGLWMRFGGRRIRLPRFLGVEALLINGVDAATGRLTVDARVRHPILGVVTEYRGAFDYRVEARSAETPP